MIIYYIFWTIAEFVALWLLICKTGYYKKLADLREKDEQTDNSKISIFLKKYRKQIKWTTIIGFTIFAPICNMIVLRETANACMNIRFFIAYLLLSLICITDFKKHIIPNSVIISVLLLRLAIFIPEYFLETEKFKNIVLNSFLSLVISFVVLTIVSLISKGGFGMGDVKLFSALGFLCGIYCVINTFIVSLVLCALLSAILLFAKSKGLKDKLPFGPFIFLGFIITIAIGAI